LRRQDFLGSRQNNLSENGETDSPLDISAAGDRKRVRAPEIKALSML
jgi:hypothetical protein